MLQKLTSKERERKIIYLYIQFQNSYLFFKISFLPYWSIQCIFFYPTCLAYIKINWLHQLELQQLVVEHLPSTQQGQKYLEYFL